MKLDADNQVGHLNIETMLLRRVEWSDQGIRGWAGVMTGLDEKRQIEEKTRQYFRRSGFRRMLFLIWGKYASLGLVGGQVTIKLAKDDECEAINEFFGNTYYRPGQSIVVTLKDFQQELLESAFPYTITELHQIVEGSRLLTKLEKKLIRQTEWRQLFMPVEESLGGRDTWVANWLRQIESFTTPGYRTLLEQFRISPEEAEIALKHTVKALDTLLRVGSNDHIRLPFLATLATGDSHALDWKRPAGRLLYYALREQRINGTDKYIDDGSEERSNLEEYAVDTLTIREVYRSAGIADDDLSAIVHIYTPSMKTPSIPTVWTLREIEAMEQFPAISALYIVENPPVFSMLLDAMNEHIRADNHLSIVTKPPMLVCSSGPASAAALRLLRRLSEHSIETLPIYYSGDFDVKGLEMGIVLANRFPEQFSPWRFDTHSFVVPVLSCPNGPDFSESESNRLLHLIVPWDADLTVVMHRKGHKVFQETLIPVLIEDWVNAVVCKIE